MPDIFIPIDTTGISDYFLAIRNSGLIYRFALKFTEDKRDAMKKYKDLASLDRWLTDQDLTSQFIRFAEQNGIPPNRQQIAISKEIIHVQLKAYIARNMLDNKGFYPIWQAIDRTLLKALEYIQGI